MLVTGFTPSTNSEQETLEKAREDLNDQLADTWIRELTKCGISNSPVMPFFGTESYARKFLSGAVDGSKIMRDTGFEYTYTDFGKAELSAALQEFIDMRLWPESLV